MCRVDKKSWLAFEFKFDLNSNEQPLIFILSRGENAEKTHFILCLKGREDKACANLIIERRVAWESFPAWEKKRKRREKKEIEWVQVSSVSTLGFWPRVWEVRSELRVSWAHQTLERAWSRASRASKESVDQDRRSSINFGRWKDSTIN